MTYIDARNWDSAALLLLTDILKEDSKMGYDDFTKENVLETLETLYEELHQMRRDGETDIRTILIHLHFAITRIREMKTIEDR